MDTTDYTALVRKYLLLAHRFERHHKGIVDAHYGYASLVKEEVMTEPIVSLSALLTSAEFILSELGQKQDARAKYLAKQTLAIKTLIEKDLGLYLSYRDEARLLLGIEHIHWQREEPLLEAMDHLDELLSNESPKGGLLHERFAEWRKKFELSGEEVLSFTNATMETMKARAESLFPLPQNEITVKLVRNKPWTGYHWYKGQYSSLYELNIDVPTTIWGVLHTTTHEAFCGHHTEAIIKEHELVNTLGYNEFSINLLGTPCSLLSEGLAEMACDVVIGDTAAVTQWLIEHNALHRRDFTEHDGKILDALERLGRKAVINAALLMHEENASDHTVEAYLAQYSPNDEYMIRRTINRLRDTEFRTYMLTYPIGKELVNAVLKSSHEGAVNAFYQLCRRVDVTFEEGLQNA